MLLTFRAIWFQTDLSAWYTLGLFFILALRSVSAAAPGSRSDISSVSQLDQTASHDSSVVRARLLMRAGEVDKADRLVRLALEANHADAHLICILGDILFRRAEFGRAASAYRTALEFDPNSARAYWGLGRLEQVQFHRKSARDFFAKAFQLDPRDPDIVLAYSDLASDPQTRLALLSTLVALTKDVDPDRAESALARLRLEQLRNWRSTKLISANTTYDLKLTGFYPTSPTPSGVLLSVRINGGKPLRLVFDTGASGILIDSKSARDLGLEFVSDSRIGGLGASALVTARIALARTVSFGSLEFKDCVVIVSERGLAPGADGVVGANTFERFQIRLDARSRVLELIPFLDDDAPGGSSALPWQAYDRSPSQGLEQSVYGLRHLLLVKTKINREKEGLFLLDTGAAFSSISEDIARQGAQRSTLVPLSGARGRLVQAFRVAPVELQVAGHPMIDPSLVSFDLRQMSQVEGLEISGILGYSLLSQSTITINYRDGVVQFGGDAVRLPPTRATASQRPFSVGLGQQPGHAEERKREWGRLSPTPF